MEELRKSRENVGLGQAWWMVFWTYFVLEAFALVGGVFWLQWSISKVTQKSFSYGFALLFQLVAFWVVVAGVGFLIAMVAFIRSRMEKRALSLLGRSFLAVQCLLAILAGGVVLYALTL